MAYGLKSRGLAEYPGYYCYDAGRPGWLPYWLDSVTESMCKWSPKTIAGNIYHCAAGEPDCGTPTPKMQDPALSGPGVAVEGTPTNVPVCNRFQTFNATSDACEFDFTSPSFLIAAGLGVVVLSMLGGGSPRRYGR